MLIIKRKMSWGISYDDFPYFTIWNKRNGVTKCVFQRRRCCAFDSPGLPNDSAGYPGVTYGLWGTTPSVLRFFWLICHKRFHCKHAFIEKAQHLRRWISLLMFTRGRLVPRQPRAIKRTTRTELRGENIHRGWRTHWNIHITFTAIHNYNIHNCGCVHWTTGITPVVLLAITIFIGMKFLLRDYFKLFLLFIRR